MRRYLLMALFASTALLVGVSVAKKKFAVNEPMHEQPQQMALQDETMEASTLAEDAIGQEYARILEESGISEEEILASVGDEESAQEHQGLLQEEEGTYSDQFDSSYLTDGQKKVLFFHAEWCPACRAQSKFLISTYPSADLIPIYKVDFDTETALRERYGVVQQHTYVKVNGRGEVIDTRSFPSDGGLMEFLRI